MIDVRLGRHALSACTAFAMLAGCGGSQSILGTGGEQATPLSQLATTLKWIPDTVTLDVNGSLSGKRKAVILELPSRKGGVDYRFLCAPYFSVKDTGKHVKDGVTYLGYLLTANTHKVYDCTWEAIAYVRGQEQTSILTIKITQ